jgi:Zn-dependent peptidase ImmA (M78 family)
VSVRVAVKPELLSWALERARLDLDDVAPRFPNLARWIAGDAQPTLKQLEQFARAMHTPIGFLFLPEPPIEPLPIPDFRTIADKPIARPSPDLLDTLYVCQERQDWYRDWARTVAEDARAFVGTVRLGDDIVRIAATIRQTLGFDLDARRKLSTWTDALRSMIELAEAVGVLVMVNGIVGCNTHRKLDPNEFRGFALSDPFAPLVFINGADTKAAQMFTLAHELVHLWLGQSALSDAEASAPPAQATERWCNEIAAELLVPLDVFQQEFKRSAPLDAEMARLARVFKVSTLVVLRRMHDAGGLGRNAYWKAFEAERVRLRDVPKGSSGGDFYRSQAARNSRRFARALIADTLEGNTLYRDAFHMLGIKRDATFREMSAQLGCPA